MKEFSRLLQKATQRLTNARSSEMTHQELLETKRKAEEDKKRAAEAGAQKDTKKRKTSEAALADHAESVAKKADQAKGDLAAKDVWKIDFATHGHPRLPVLSLKIDSAQVDWNIPFVVKDVVAGADSSSPTAAEVETFLFGDKFG
eukprot:15036461-Heterocapsa_arctica.AAC.1